MRVLVIQKSLSPPGGGNAVAAWMVHALARDHEVATLTASEWWPASTNTFYGTAIPERGITQHLVPAPWRWLASLRDDRLTRVRICSLLRAARPLAAQYDRLITADNYAVFAKPGWQYVHFPTVLEPEPERWGLAVRPYFAMCDWLLGAPWSEATRNVTLANSRWTAERLPGELGRPIVLYPPVLDPGSGLPWAERDNTFLCVGRFHKSKRIELAISIVRAARAKSLPQARLIIVGSAVDAAYASELRRIAAVAGDWIEFRTDLSRQALNALMGRTRFGIQAMVGEHFGMATAEMARAGCLVFAHRSGGSPEVLNDEDALLWRSKDEAVERIVSVRDPEQLSARLQRQARRFSAESFVAQFLSIVQHGDR